MGANLQKIIFMVCLLGLTGAFAYSGMIKMSDANAFYKAIEGYRIFPEWIVPIATYYVPAFEIVCAGGLLFQRTRFASASLLSLLLCIFIVLLFSALLRGLDVNCGCFGKSESSDLALWIAIFRDIGMLMASGYVTLRCANAGK